jgi:two-component system, OmpR family, KDP operon response regulator KdpE
MRRPSVLIVDDEPRIQRFVRAELESEGYRTSTADSGAAALAVLEREQPAVIVLDLVLPDVDGFEVLRQIRAISRVPVILLTARRADADKVRGLNQGADDYLTKPFNPEELTARVRAILRRTSQDQEQSPRPLVLGELQIDFEQRQVHVGERDVSLSPTEWKLLTQLARRAGRVVLHEDLLSMTWGSAYRDDLQYLRVWISRLRKKLCDDSADPRYIQTVSGVGYMLRGQR